MIASVRRCNRVRRSLSAELAGKRSSRGRRNHLLWFLSGFGTPTRLARNQSPNVTPVAQTSRLPTFERPSEGIHHLSGEVIREALASSGVQRLTAGLNFEGMRTSFDVDVELSVVRLFRKGIDPSLLHGHSVWAGGPFWYASTPGPEASTIVPTDAGHSANTCHSALQPG